MIEFYSKLISPHKYFFAFLFILTLGLYLRFYGIESYPDKAFGWDQARDAWKVRDILKGMLVLDGPKTGIGNMHLGPLYFYFLAPFFAFTKLDPIASIYFTIAVNIVTFIILYLVTKKFFSEKAAIFAVFLYSTSNYIIKQNQIPWNVSLVPVTSILLFYTLFRIRTGGRKYWYIVLGILTGLFFHLHFTAVFLPPIILLSLFPYGKNIKNFLLLCGSFAIAAFFLIPTLIFDLKSSHGEFYKYSDFIKHYTHGFHLRFFLLRLTDAFVQFKLIIFFSLGNILQYVIPFLFGFVLLFEKDKTKKIIGLLMLPWFLIPLLFFTIYAGPISDYYFLVQAPLVIFVLIYLQQKLLKKFPYLLLPLFLFWTFYAYANTKEFWIKPTGGGLDKQKQEAAERVRSGNPILFNEGEIKSYLYVIWTEDSTKKN
jgi:4-amino-4-deoxy-L-arabinose transferase-like glycosyltransferase